MGLILPGDDVMSITERVQQGDPTVGWRGDATMDVYVKGGYVEVWGFDARGERYRVVSVPLSDPGWRHSLLARLRDSDWRRDDHLERLRRQNAKWEKDTKDEWVDSRGEKFEKVAWMVGKVT